MGRTQACGLKKGKSGYTGPGWGVGDSSMCQRRYGGDGGEEVWNDLKLAEIKIEKG